VRIACGGAACAVKDALDLAKTERRSRLDGGILGKVRWREGLVLCTLVLYAGWKRGQ
jgi:hypothetical protein